jgi:CHAT domain-containing protein
VERLLLDRAEDILAGRADSAAARLERARAISRLYADALGSSFCRDETELHAGWTPDRLRASAEGWRAYADASALVPRWAAALAPLDAALAAADRAGDPYLELRARHLAARCRFMTGDPGTRESMERARDLARRLGERALDLGLTVDLGRASLAEDRLTDALETVRGVLAPAHEAQDWTAYLSATSIVVACFLQLGEPDAARPVAEEGVAVARREGERRWEAELLGLLGDVQGITGRYADAVARREEALRIQRELGADGPQLQSLIALAWLHGAWERHSQALVLLREGLDLAQRAGIAEAATILQMQIGETYLRLGRPDDALRHYEEVLPAARAVNAPRHLASILHGIASARHERNGVQDALPWYEEAWETARSAEVSLNAEQFLLDLACACEESGARDAAERHAEEARALGERMRNPYAVGEAERALGRILAARGREDEGRRLIRQAVGRGRSIGVSSLLRNALVDAADLAVAVGDFASADTMLAEALEIVESVRERQAGEEIRLGFLADKKSIYARRVDVLLRLGREEEAFDVSERARARALLDALGGAVQDARVYADSTLREKELRQAARLRDAQAALSRAVSSDIWDEAAVASSRQRAEEAAREYRATLDEISARDPAWGELSGSRAPLGLAGVRTRVLAGDQTLLEYLVGEKESFAFLVGRNRFRAARIAAGEDSLRVLVDELRASSGASAASTARDLFGLLVAPLRADLPESARVLVVPDGPLFHLPFALLRDDAGLLVERHAIALAPSASALDRSIRPRARKAGAPTLLAVGNPATFRAQTLLADVRDGEDWRFGELPWAEEEVRRVAARFDRATVVTGADATEPFVKAAMSAASHLHFATHGRLDEREPILSGLALAPSAAGAEGAGDDGLLQAHEIVGLRLDADLAVLSACNTALGRIAGGEGVVGLSRAFLHAGARSLVLSLWEVADRSTAELMDDFYGAHLDGGAPPDVALQRAQLAAIARGRPVREWAPFVVVGGTDAPRRAGGSRRWLAPVVLGAALAVLVLAVRRRRRPPAAAAGVP